MPQTLEEVVSKITTTFEPVSIFLYGSRARTDFLEKSDYEVGALYHRDKKISRVALKELVSTPDINVYPFEYEDFLNYKLDTPFPEVIYLRELIQGGKTIYGEKVIETLKAPPILVSDLLQRNRFDTAFALAAVLSHRHGDMITASMEFSKSCLFAMRTLITFRLGLFPLTYDEIYAEAQKLEIPTDYAEVVQHAIDVRKGADPREVYLYRNISLMNKLIKEELKAALKDGDRVILD